MAAVPRLDFPVAEAPLRTRLAELPGSSPALTERLPGCRFTPRCTLATGRCAETMPPMTRLSSSHTVACWVRTA